VVSRGTGGSRKRHRTPMGVSKRKFVDEGCASNPKKQRLGEYEGGAIRI